MKTLILGLGNDLFGDDGVGNHVVRLLQQQREKGENDTAYLEGIELLECSLTGLRLLDVIEGFDRVILIDTIKRSQPITGRVSHLRGEDLRATPVCMCRSGSMSSPWRPRTCTGWERD